MHQKWRFPLQCRMSGIGHQPDRNQFFFLYAGYKRLKLTVTKTFPNCSTAPVAAHFSWIGDPAQFCPASWDERERCEYAQYFPFSNTLLNTETRNFLT